MLPRVASTTGISQPSPALQAGVTADAAASPPVSAAALANLRAEVLLRLIETMLKHLPRTAEPNAGRDLLETLLSTLRTAPGREGESTRRFSDILAKVPPELRPRIDKLIGTVLSAMPTRGLVEIVRNPDGPQAHRLAAMLATVLQADDLPMAGAERQPRPVGLNAQQLAAVGRQGLPPAAQTVGDARALQTVLKRIFESESGGKPRAAGSEAAPAETRDAARPEPRLPAPLAKAGNRQPVDETQPAIRHQGGAEEIETATVKQEATPVRARLAHPEGQAIARGILQAMARDQPPAQLTQAVAQFVETLSPEEATIIRALLERPLDPATEQELALMVREQAEDGQVPEAMEKTRPRTAETAPALPQPAAEPDEALPMPQAREAAQAAALADALPDRLPPTAMLREGVPLAFVPYLPAEEDIAWPEGRQSEAEEDEPAGEEGEAGEDAEPERGGEEEPESADMARRREKAAEMVGVIEPGLVFYQKLGDYWT